MIYTKIETVYDHNIIELSDDGGGGNVQCVFPKENIFPCDSIFLNLQTEDHTQELFIMNRYDAIHVCIVLSKR